MPGPDEKDPTYRVCIVKRNDGHICRLCDANTLLQYHYTGKAHRVEVEIVSKGAEDFSNELWQKGSVIWFSPSNPRIWEATCEDEQAVKENVIMKDLIDKVEDVDPTKEQKEGTLLKLILSDKYSIVDGQGRSITFD